MRTLDPGIFRRIDRLIDAGVMAWAITIELKIGQALYLTNSNAVIYRNAQVYQPFPLKVGEISDSGDGDLPTFTITLSNVGRFPMPYLESRATWDQATTYLELVYVPQPEALVLQIEGSIQAATASSASVSLSIAAPNFYDRPFPGLRWIRSDGNPGIPKNRH